jgi:L-ascorbate metabolism protein UlaG (beta-lactamase superfamily)
VPEKLPLARGFRRRRFEEYEPDSVYLSHHHFDHSHFPSLRSISKNARLFITMFGADVMRHELDRLESSPW